MEAFGVPADRARDVVLLTSEVVTNAIRHGGAKGSDDRVRIRVASRDERVRVEVRDDGPGFHGKPAVRSPGTSGVAGMGLELVAGLADAWGTGREGTTTVVWFEVDPKRTATPIH